MKTERKGCGREEEIADPEQKEKMGREREGERLLIENRTEREGEVERERDC